MKQYKAKLIVSSLIFSLANVSAHAHQVPGDLLSLHHGATHPGVGITHIVIMLGAVAIAWCVAKRYTPGR